MLKTEEFDKAPTKPLSMICYRNSDTKLDHRFSGLYRFTWVLIYHVNLFDSLNLWSNMVPSPTLSSIQKP